MKEIFKRNGIILILVSLILFNTLPQTLCAMVMKMTNYFLSNSTIMILNLISSIFSYAIFALGLSKFLDSKDKFKDIIKCLPIFIGYEVIFLFNFIFNRYGLDNYLILNIVHLIISSIVFVSGLFISVFNITGKRLELCIKNIIKLLIIGILVYIVPDVLCGLLGNILHFSLFNISIISGILYGIIMWIFVIMAIFYMQKDMNIDFKLKEFIIYISCGVLLVLLMVLYGFVKTNNVKVINNMISYALASGDYAFDEMEVLTAKSFYNNGKEYKCAYAYAIDNSSNISGCSSDLLDLFKDLNSEDSIKLLKEKVNDKTANIYDLEALMKLMKDTNDKDIGKITSFLVSSMNFSRETVLPFDLSEKEKEKLKEDLSKYDRHIIVRKYIDIYDKWLSEGTLNSSVISTATKIASENKYEIALQAAALKFYIDASIDVSKFGSSNVVDNFVNLTKDEVSKKSDKEIIAYKTYVATAYQKVNNNDKAIKFLEEFKPNVMSGDIGSLLLVSYRKNRKYEKAEDMALKVFKVDEYNVEALAFMSIYKLQSDLDESIKYALKLAKVISDKKNNYSGADIALGMYRVYLFGYYEPLDSAFCPYSNFYSKMSDEQKKLLTNNEIINAYIIGQGLAKENLDTLNKVIAKYDYISYLYYYRGVYEVNNKEFESAVKDLEKAISLNKHPFFYSELGFAYEGVNDLKKSLEAFEMASSKIDEYGLGSTTYNYNNIHNYFNVYINNAKHAMYESEAH